MTGTDGMDEVFRALADPSRRRLLDRLNARGGQSLRELCVGLDMARQSVSKHLAVLEAANLVTTVRRGREKWHYLNAAPINDIADRWISRYHRERVAALADLKRALEDTPMPKPEFVYTTYIRTTPERLWQALIDPAFTRRYWGLAFESDWKVGSTMTWVQGGAAITDPDQVVLEYDPYRRLAYTWHSYTPEWADEHGFDADVLAELSRSPRTKVTFDLEPVESMVKLTVTHDDFEPGSRIAAMLSEGWPRVLSALKTLLETAPADGGGYEAEVIIGAPRERVFEALTTLEGLAGWWTPAVSGVPTTGGDVTFEFADQQAVMRVDEAEAPTSVVWTCLAHSGQPEWQGTTLRFTVRAADADTTRLTFRHVGLVPALECYQDCQRGWDHYLASLADHVAGGGGRPHGSPGWAPARVLLAQDQASGTR